MNTKTDGISSGLVTVAWMNKRNGFIAKEGGRDYQEPLIRLSDAEALIADLTKQRNENYAAYNKLNVEAGQIIAEKDAEIEKLHNEVEDALFLNDPECKRLREEVERLTFALAETEALEISHVEVIERLTWERDAADTRCITQAQINAELVSQVATLTAALEAAKKDAERYRWLTEDHQSIGTRMKCWDILNRIPVMSYSAASEAIDAALAKGDEK